MATDAATCPLTFEIMENPVTLSCGHSFEKAPLQRWKESCSGMQMTPCPTCRKLFDDVPAVNLQMQTLISHHIYETYKPQDEPRRQLKMKHALAYVGRVQMKFQNNRPHIFQEFMAIMKEFKQDESRNEHNTFISRYIDRIIRLFDGHRELVLDFNAFLPSGYKIEFDDLGVAQVMYPSGVHAARASGSSGAGAVMSLAQADDENEPTQRRSKRRRR